MGANIRRTIIIGLGGTGALTVLYVKKMLYQFYGDLPLAVKFLVLDTDRRLPDPLKVVPLGKEITAVEIKEKEFFYLPVNDPEGVIRSSESIKKWWPEPLPPQSAINGAGQVRAIGRLAFYAHARHIKETLESMVKSVTDIKLKEDMLKKQGLNLVTGAGIDVYVIGSLAGGTGSGTFIDMGFLLQKILPAIDHKIYAVLFLPWVFKGLPITHRIEMNAYAALKEIDYYMSLDYSRQKVRFLFGDEIIDANYPPYNVINLIDGRNEAGVSIRGSEGSKGIENLCEQAGLAIALTIGNVGQRAESALDNLRDIFSQDKKKWGGKYPWCSSFGTSMIVYPIEKHYNRMYSLYALNLITELLSIVKGEKVTADESELEKDVDKFLTEAHLDETNDNIIEALFPILELEKISLPEGIKSPYELDDYVKSEETRIKESVEREIEKNISQKNQITEEISKAISQRISEYSPIYGLRFGKEIQSRVEAFKNKRLEEIKELGVEVKRCKEDSDRFFEENIQNLSKWNIFRRKKEFYQNYINRVNQLIKLETEIKRRKKALEIYGKIVDTVRKCIEELNLPKVENILLEVENMIKKEYFSSTIVRSIYGENTIIISEKEIVIKSKEGKKWESFIFTGSKEDFTQLGIPIEINDFLNSSGLKFEDLSKVDVTDLFYKIIEYAQKKTAFVKDITVENVLLKDIEHDKEKEEQLKFWLKEASDRAKPLWFHKATADIAARMEEIFIIGVGDSSKTPLARMEYPEAKYPPTFTSTQDPYKIFYLKFKAPLPAYLLKDMKDYRRSYLDVSLLYTPHIEKEIELKAPDIFPETRIDKFIFRIFTLALSTGMIKKDPIEDIYYIDHEKCLKPREEKIELGNAIWNVFEEMKEEKRKEFWRQLQELLEEEIKNSPDKVTERLKEYHTKIKDIFNKREETMSIGDEIVFYEQIKLLDEFFKKDEKIENFLRIEE